MSGQGNKRIYLLSLIFFYASTSYSQSDSIFKTLSFGKGVTAFSAGGGAVKRYIDKYYFDPDVNEYYKSPSLSFSIDHCIYPYASNAYLGLGPFLNSWVAHKKYSDGLIQKESTFYNLLVAAKLTHHTSYFVTKHLDVCSGYIVGINIRQYQEKNSSNLQSEKQRPETIFTPAFGLSLTIRYYFYHNFGLYAEGGIGYKLNILNFGMCFKLKKKN